MRRLYSSSALEAEAVASTGRCYIDEVICTNTGASTVYLQVFDSATAVANGTAQELTVAVPAGATVSWDGEAEDSFGAGCYVCISTTAATKTLGAAEAVFTVRGRV